MTVDDLMEAYCSAYSDCLIGTEDGLQARRAGVTAIVRALRDEMNRVDWDLHESAIEVLDGILGDAGEKDLLDAGSGGRPATSETTSGDVANAQGEANPKRVVPNSPATDAAPAVCEWTRVDKDTLESGCDPDGLTNSPKIYWDECPNCSLPIKFTEVK